MGAIRPVIEDGTYAIRQARPRDVRAIMNLLAEATQWLREMGHDQWQGSLGRR